MARFGCAVADNDNLVEANNTQLLPDDIQWSSGFYRKLPERSQLKVLRVRQVFSMGRDMRFFLATVVQQECMQEQECL